MIVQSEHGGMELGAVIKQLLIEMVDLMLANEA